LAAKSTKFGRITQNDGHYAVHGHRFFLLIESPYPTSY